MFNVHHCLFTLRRLSLHLSLLSRQNYCIVNRKMPKGSKIPDRWEGYSKMGTVIEGTSIVPIKVPLREDLTRALPSEERFSPSTLIELIQENDLKLGGIVDLTYTTKYYNPQLFTKNDIGYEKVFTAGHVIPNKQTFLQFANAIKTLEKEGQVICVHCTHGLNRSGYMICRYMIEVLNIEPQTAIQLFEQARGHKMERQNYIDDLMRRTPGAMANVPCAGNHIYFEDSSPSQQGPTGCDYGIPEEKPMGRRRKSHRNREEIRHQKRNADSGAAAHGESEKSWTNSRHIVWDDSSVPSCVDQRPDATWNNRLDSGHHRNGNIDWRETQRRGHEDRYQCDREAGRWRRHWRDDGDNQVDYSYNGGRGRRPYHHDYSRDEYGNDPRESRNAFYNNSNSNNWRSGFRSKGSGSGEGTRHNMRNYDYR